MTRLALFVVTLLLVASCASAQVVLNPGHVEYTPSTDHAQLTKYVMGFFLSGAALPVQTGDLPIVTPGSTGTVLQALPFAVPVAGLVYTARMQACINAVCSDWSADSNQFARSPGGIVGVPAVKK